jgi:hypothetical protein
MKSRAEVYNYYYCEDYFLCKIYIKINNYNHFYKKKKFNKSI